MKNTYLILLIVIIVGIIAIFALTFLTTGGQENLAGAAAWIGGGGECEGWDREISMNQPKSQRDCELAGGTWKKAAQ
jgi:hypothetical protein